MIRLRRLPREREGPPALARRTGQPREARAPLPVRPTPPPADRLSPALVTRPRACSRSCAPSLPAKDPLPGRNRALGASQTDPACAEAGSATEEEGQWSQGGTHPSSGRRGEPEGSRPDRAPPLTPGPGAGRGRDTLGASLSAGSPGVALRPRAGSGPQDTI